MKSNWAFFCHCTRRLKKQKNLQYPVPNSEQISSYECNSSQWGQWLGKTGLCRLLHPDVKNLWISVSPTNCQHNSPCIKFVWSITTLKFGQTGDALGFNSCLTAKHSSPISSQAGQWKLLGAATTLHCAAQATSGNAYWWLQGSISISTGLQLMSDLIGGVGNWHFLQPFCFNSPKKVFNGVKC